jgi:hypothetical protein
MPGNWSSLYSDSQKRDRKHKTMSLSSTRQSSSVSRFYPDNEQWRDLLGEETCRQLITDAHSLKGKVSDPYK